MACNASFRRRRVYFVRLLLATDNLLFSICFVVLSYVAGDVIVLFMYRKTLFISVHGLG